MKNHEPMTIEDADTFARENLIAYSGDVDCATYGGSFVNLNRDHHENGYIECLRICSMDDEPFTSLILVESLTILVDAPGSKDWNDCARCCGFDSPDGLSTRASRLARWVSGFSLKPGRISRFLGSFVHAHRKGDRRWPARFVSWTARALRSFSDRREMRQATENRAQMSERERISMDADISLSYGRYDPAELGYQHHTFIVASEPLPGDDDSMSVFETAGLKPQANAWFLDDDGDAVFDEAAFWRIVQERADATFTDLTSEDNLSVSD